MGEAGNGLVVRGFGMTARCFPVGARAPSAEDVQSPGSAAQSLRAAVARKVITVLAAMTLTLGGQGAEPGEFCENQADK